MAAFRATFRWLHLNPACSSVQRSPFPLSISYDDPVRVRVQLQGSASGEMYEPMLMKMKSRNKLTYLLEQKLSYLDHDCMHNLDPHTDNDHI
jgi:hypothetical protein